MKGAIAAVSNAVKSLNTALGEAERGSGTLITVQQAMTMHDAAKVKWAAIEAGLQAWRDADIREASRREHLTP